MANAILGISAFYHDSAAALLVDGKIVAAAHEERFSRIKHDSSFPVKAVAYVLNEAGLGVSDLTAVAFYDKPYIKFERLLETYHALAPAGLSSFLSAIPVWIKEKLFMKQMIWEALAGIEGGQLGKKPPLLFPEHHLSHGASAFYPSPFQKAAIVTIDGVGEWATTTIGIGDGEMIKILKELPFPHSLGLLYSAFTHYCGFRVNSGEYKLMGLAPYGNPDSPRLAQFKEKTRQHLVDIKPDGSFLLNMDYFDFAAGLTMTRDAKWEKLFGLPRRESESELTQAYMDMALAIQQITEEVVMLLARTAHELTGCDHLVMAGGVALNCVANGKLLAQGPFKDLWIQPSAGDAGGALGAAYAAFHLWKGMPRTVDPDGADSMHGSYLGPEFEKGEILRMTRKFGAPYRYFNAFDDLCRETAGHIAEGSIVGWFQGRMEWGPRALGNRSILGDPRDPDMQKRLNLKIKYREGFRPFAPSVLEERVNEYFEFDGSGPYMQLVVPVKAERRQPMPQGYDGMELYDRLYQLRSDIPAVTHVDYSARIQTVSLQTNPRYWHLINAFREITGYGLVVNTSFNVRGEPIVCTPEDAYRCFMRTDMDWLVIGDYLFRKEEQPTYLDKENWQETYQLD